MYNTERIEIKLSKTKLIFLLAGCFIFIAIGISFIINPGKYKSYMFRNSDFIFLSGICAVLLFGFFSLFISRKIKDKSPGMVISEKGIIDNSGGLSVGFIPWEDISKIVEKEIIRQKFICIILKDPKVYIEKQKTGWKRKALEINYKRFGSVVGISCNSLESGYDDLKKLLDKKFDEHTKRNR